MADKRVYPILTNAILSKFSRLIACLLKEEQESHDMGAGQFEAL